MGDYRLPRPPSSTPPLYAQDGKGYDAVVHAHYFAGGSDWLVTEYDPDDDIAFGWACLNGDREMAELGYTSLAELEQAVTPVRLVMPDRTRIVGMHVEYETDWVPMTLRDAVALIDQRHGRTET